MRLVGHHQNVRAFVQLRESGFQIRFAELVNHRHHQIRRLTGQQLLERLDAVGHLDLKANALAGLAQLFFELGAVGHKNHFPLGQRCMSVHLAHHEHHGQRLAAALCVPNDAAACAWVLARQQAVDGFLHSLELLMPAHHLDQLTFVAGAKNGEGADDAEQIRLRHHACHHPLLVIGAAATLPQVIDLHRVRVCPTVEVLFVVRRDGSKLGLVSARHHQELVERKQGRAALTLGATLLAVTHQLVDGLRQSVFHLGRLGLDHHHRNAVHKQHHVGNDVVLSAPNAHLELAHRHKAVVLDLVEVNELDGGAFRARGAVLAHAGAFGQQAENMLVVLQQVAARQCRHLLHHLVGLVVLQPRLNQLELRTQHRLHQHLGQVAAVGLAWGLLRLQIQHLPAQPPELVQQRQLNVVALVQFDLFLTEFVHTLFLWWSHCLPKAVNLYFWSRLLGLSGNV